MNDNNQIIGRVLRASAIGFAVGCRVNQLDAPAFGALVKAIPIESKEVVYGLIYNINIDDDPLVRRLALAENPRPETINDQRRNRLLPIEMSVLAVGYRLNGTLNQGLSPRPPLNLDPVEICWNQAEIIEFTDKLGYLRLLLSAGDLPVPVNQLIAAHILDMYRRRDNDLDWTLAAIQELIELLRTNYDLLIPTLEALSDAMPALANEIALPTP